MDLSDAQLRFHMQGLGILLKDKYGSPDDSSNNNRLSDKNIRNNKKKHKPIDERGQFLLDLMAKNRKQGKSNIGVLADFCNEGYVQ